VLLIQLSYGKMDPAALPRLRLVTGCMSGFSMSNEPAKISTGSPTRIRTTIASRPAANHFGRRPEATLHFSSSASQ
jgi:hypothetical protein